MWLSVIVPVYNVKDYLEACVNSILANDCRDCEIILVDDGSTDGVSGAICDRLAQQHEIIRCIHQENGGLGAARNTGIEHAQGDYLWFIDSDDKIAANAISYLHRKQQEHQADIITFDYYDDNGITLTAASSSAPPFDQPFSLEDRPTILQISPSACFSIWRRELFITSKIRFPSKVFYEDLRTTLKLRALALKMVTVQEPLYYYLNRPGSIMNTANLQRNEEILWACEDIMDWFRLHGLETRYRATLESIIIDHVFVFASIRVLKQNPRHPLLSRFYSYTEKNAPGFRSIRNAQSGVLHKIVYWFLVRKRYSFLHRLFCIQNGEKK